MRDSHTVAPVRAERTVLGGSAITLTLVTADRKVVTLCRDLMREIEGAEVAPAVAEAGLEVTLWDCDPGQEFPSDEEAGSPNLFCLVAPAHVEPLLRRLPSAEGNILLKPVTGAVLRAFLGSVIQAGRASAGGDDSIRVSRDDFLQRLLGANLRLQQYDQQRTNFIARAVHDFRAPLTALSGFCGLLASGELGPLNEQQTEALARMQHSTRRLSRMASAMFELSIGPKVNHKIELHQGDITERVKQAVYEILPAAREKGITVSSQNIAAPGGPLYFEPSQIEQVLVNLLDNACKFTHRGGTIEVRGYPYFWERRFLSGPPGHAERRTRRIDAPNAYRVDVMDTGPGIPPAHVLHIFEEYTSYAGSQDRSGGGLGLAICRLIMSRHQGHIWAESNADGAVFSFVLPYRWRETEGGQGPARPAASAQYT